LLMAAGVHPTVRNPLSMHMVPMIRSLLPPGASPCQGLKPRKRCLGPRRCRRERGRLSVSRGRAALGSAPRRVPAAEEGRDPRQIRCCAPGCICWLRLLPTFARRLRRVRPKRRSSGASLPQRW
jgi:hypothetical protein